MTFQDTDQRPAPGRVKIGKIVMPHGVKGLVKILPLIEEITDYPDVFIDTHSDKSLRLAYKNRLNKYILAEIEGFTSRNDAEALGKCDLYVTADAAEMAEEYADWAGSVVIDETGAPIGTVRGIENFGASDLLDIRLSSGKDVMVPLTEDFVTESEDGLIVRGFEAFL